MGEGERPAFDGDRSTTTAGCRWVPRDGEDDDDDDDDDDEDDDDGGGGGWDQRSAYSTFITCRLLPDGAHVFFCAC